MKEPKDECEPHLPKRWLNCIRCKKQFDLDYFVAFVNRDERTHLKAEVIEIIDDVMKNRYIVTRENFEVANTLEFVNKELKSAIQAVFSSENTAVQENPKGSPRKP